jgi:malate synthase
LNKQVRVQGVEVTAPVSQAFAEILTRESLEFVANLVRRFSGVRDQSLQKRVERQAAIDGGQLPDFLPETAETREGSWKVRPVPRDLLDRRVEITGPSGDTKMVINAFNSGANVYMADFEDSQSPTWHETIQGQINLRDAIDRSVKFVSQEGKVYSLNDKIATLIVRPRGWHLLERHVLVDGKPVSASIFDFGLFIFHNARRLSKKGTGPYFYLPKIESHLEARLWSEVFDAAERELNLARGTIKATVLIETILAAFEMDEILYELKEHSSGLNCGRWDYIFSFIKKFRNDPRFILPERSQVTMDKGFLAAYVNLLIRTCHRRGAHAIGGMSAYIPVRSDDAANRTAFEKVRADKEREVKLGHDGTWVAHPGLVPLAKEVFDGYMKGANQLEIVGNGPKITAADLLRIPGGQITETGIRTNVNVGVQYIESWLRGKGAVPLYDLMEDAATAEICRAQLWQWIRHTAAMNDGRSVTLDLVRTLAKEELNKLSEQLGAQRYHSGMYELASTLFDQMLVAREFPEFLTTIAYDKLLSAEEAK